MAAEIYDQIFGYWNGGLFSESTKIDTELRTDAQPIATQIKDFGGMTPSPLTRSVTAEFVIPLGGDEYDFEGAMARREFGVLKLLQMSGKQYEGSAYITSVKKSAGVGQTTNMSVEFVAEGKPFE